MCQGIYSLLSFSGDVLWRSLFTLSVFLYFCYDKCLSRSEKSKTGKQKVTTRSLSHRVSNCCIRDFCNSQDQTHTQKEKEKVFRILFSVHWKLTESTKKVWISLCEGTIHKMSCFCGWSEGREMLAQSETMYVSEKDGRWLQLFYYLDFIMHTILCSVDIMRGKLDSEELGIITRTSFMDEFFHEDEIASPSQFILYHYNGLPRSCPQGKVGMEYLSPLTPLPFLVQPLSL